MTQMYYRSLCFFEWFIRNTLVGVDLSLTVAAHHRLWYKGPLCLFVCIFFSFLSVFKLKCALRKTNEPTTIFFYMLSFLVCFTIFFLFHLCSFFWSISGLFVNQYNFQFSRLNYLQFFCEDWLNRYNLCVSLQLNSLSASHVFQITTNPMDLRHSLMWWKCNHSRIPTAWKN